MSDIETLYYCGSRANARGRVTPWRKRALTWRLDGSLPNLSDVQTRSAIGEAFTAWQGVCGLTFREASANERVDIVCTTGPIDTSGQVLAWSELPDGSDRQLTQRYDTKDAFVVAARPGRGQIDLLAVACHEIGHALGLDHDQEGTGSLLEPTYEPGRRTPQQRDVQRIQALYGPPLAIPTPTPGPGPEPGEPIVIQIFGAQKITIPGYRVTPA